MTHRLKHKDSKCPKAKGDEAQKAN
ncbi:hypothetical protein CCACVL1_03712 [Corchorus capsularis]|uniref:Uncharacterized protein n=1 Tax=Corchorus capsularis TaxID=210143 RepID=A0A1R3JXR8_COCAP|nr:hypothetical protein CCACVL1_03712 [Corchorus capsularis]